MSIFATEFEVKNGISKSTFVAAIVAWLRGINRSTILDGADAHENYDDEVWRENAKGETLSLKSYEDGDTSVFGARLEIPDELGLKWRTECVLTSKAGRSYLRVRGQCVAVSHSAEVTRPKKPHIIRQAIEDGWCVADGPFEPSLNARVLETYQIEVATAAIEGNATTFLPSLFVSRANKNALPFDVK